MSKDFMKIDRAKYIDTGLVTEREHPTEPYVIYNYTPLCQYSKAWDEITMQCRGLILHKDTGEVIARPFKKFFNYEEHIQNGLPIPQGIPEVYDKRDGSLGILYWGTDGKPWIATRGSFMSEQAVWATEFLRSHMDGLFFDRDFTYLFEIIYPSNRIVVNYGSYEGLDLLAMIHTKSSGELGTPDIVGRLGTSVYPVPFTSFEELKARNEKNSEGFVLFWRKEGLRLKIKFEDYVRLHKVMTGLSEIGLWEMLRDGKTIAEIVVEIPDEMHAWIHSVVAPMVKQYEEIEGDATCVLMRVRSLPTRKDQALIVSKSKYPSVVFSMLDKKDYKSIIWKMLRPHGSSTFRNDIDV
jgi:RNA ligase